MLLKKYFTIQDLSTLLLEEDILAIRKKDQRPQVLRVKHYIAYLENYYIIFILTDILSHFFKMATSLIISNASPLKICST